METIGLELGDAVNVVADPDRKQIITTPVEPPLPGVRLDFLDRVDRFIDQYRPALEKLAKE
jgi:hypothetical protein